MFELMLRSFYCSLSFLLGLVVLTGCPHWLSSLKVLAGSSHSKFSRVVLAGCIAGSSHWSLGATSVEVSASELQCFQQSPVDPARGNQVIPIKVACVVY